MKLYSYYRSSAAYRVRIALAIKNLDYETIPIHLLKDGGEQHSSDYLDVNPQKLVPALIHDGKTILQSLAIIEYLEEQFPAPPLLPEDRYLRAFCRSIAYNIACDTHPLNNLRVLNYLTAELKINDEEKQRWYSHWINTTFTGLEKQLSQLNADISSSLNNRGCYCLGATPTLADVLLIPQVFNALRFNVPLTPYPLIHSIYKHCTNQPAFQRAAPERQIDAE